MNISETPKSSDNNKSFNKKNIIKTIAFSIPILLVISFFTFATIRYTDFSKTFKAEALSLEESAELNLQLKNQYASRYQILQPLPYKIDNLNISIGAESVILIDISNGNIIFEKNADEVIPPASMTKLFAMYVVDQEVSAGRLNYSDIIPLPEESWACNMPPHSSLMFLGKGQIVTLEELLLGLSICSGNDAAYALAYTICGTMEAFVDRMNQVADELGLTHTHFVESSGYSELNTTTAREMAAFCRVYILQHPDSLKRFHSVSSFTYPKAKNMAPGDKYEAQDWSKGLPEHITMGITQENTNPLLGKLEGCDGLKTGYIDESGYNLSLTAERQGTRFLSVTMKGPGSNSREGQAGRIADGTALMENAFSSFRDYTNLQDLKPYFVRIYGGDKKAVNLIPGFKIDSVCVPFITGNSMKENMEKVVLEIDTPAYLEGNINAGEAYGEIRIILENNVLETIPLVADRTVFEGNIFIKAADCLIKKPILD